MSNEYIRNMSALRFNPLLMQRAVLNKMEEVYQAGPLGSHPTTPLDFLIEATVATASATVLEAEALTRRQYESLALTYDDLYHHMSDKDYLGRFSTPASTVLRVIMGRDEVIRRSVPYGDNGARKLVIPRHTEVIVGDLTFTMQYPIEIRIMAHQGIQVVYDGSESSPLVNLETNIVDWDITKYQDQVENYLSIYIPMNQFAIKSEIIKVTISSPVKKTFAFDDEFYYCRVFNRQDGGDWVEIKTTHSDQVYDPLQLTALLRVEDSIVTVSLPKVYQNTNLVGIELRCDIYTTKGPVDLALNTIDISEFSWRWIDHGWNRLTPNTFSAPLANLQTVSFLSDRRVSGGQRGMSFDRLRERVITNTLMSSDLPITNTQMISRLEDIGYDASKYIDNITERSFVATRRIPSPKGLSGGMGSMVGRLSFNFEQLSKLPTVSDNNERITLLPNTLFEDNDGVFSIVDHDRYIDIMSNTRDVIADIVSTSNFLFTPFHYVLDITTGTFLTRSYYFENPTIVNKYFIEENETMNIQVSTDSYSIKKRLGGWTLQISTKSSDEFKEIDDNDIYVQLRINPKGENKGAFLNGELISINDQTKERLYEFQFDTTWDVNTNDELVLTSFAMFDTITYPFKVDLVDWFEILYCIKNPRLPGQEHSNIDENLGKHLLPNDVYGLYHEKIKIDLGVNIDNLWKRSRSTISDVFYDRHTQDVFETYPENVYESDAAGNTIIWVNGRPTYTLKHKKGDVVLDINGKPKVLYAAGTPKLDATGVPIVIEGRKIEREADFVVFDGRYYFATSKADLVYKRLVPELIKEWMVTDLYPIRKRLLEKTTLQFKPKTTMGLLDAVIGENKHVKLRADLTLVVRLYVDRSTHKDSKLKEALKNTTVATIARLLDRSVVTTSEMISTIRAALGSDVIGVDMDSVGGYGTQTVITINDNVGRLSIGTKLVNLPDDTFVVRDDITVEFIRHKEDLEA